MQDELRVRLYEAYSTTHAGVMSDATARFAFQRDIAPHLPPDREARVVDLGCGQGQLVRLLQEHGHTNATGIDVSAEQVRLARQAGIVGVELGDFREVFGREQFDVVTATDFFEHLDKIEVLEALDRINAALSPGGRLIVRVPNAVSPFGGNFRYGDFTHETSFTAGSLRQLSLATGFADTAIYPCSPVVHGIRSVVRSAIWKTASGAMKLVLAAETGVLHGHLVTQNIVAVLRKN